VGPWNFVALTRHSDHQSKPKAQVFIQFINLSSFLNHIFLPHSDQFSSRSIPPFTSLSYLTSSSKVAHMLKPTDFGGWGRGAGLDGGLTGVEFSARCPPPLRRRTRIVAVCGINDFRNASSPQEDGWFHSDFYLFHHLFSGLGESSQSMSVSMLTLLIDSNQVWLTCVDPACLVSKYKEFVHGNRLEMRRIVLDAEMLPDIQRAENIRVVTPDDLLERFLATVRSECQLAVSNQESVLVLIFGHGDKDTYGVAIGGKTSVAAAPLLTIRNMNIAIGNTAKVALMMTSCFSGGWVINTTQDGSKAALNATVMAAAGPKARSESWAQSQSSGRAAGSIYASALVKAAIRMQIMDEEEDEDEDDIVSSSAYVGWTKLIHDTGRTEVDRLFWKHDIRFAAQNDLWDSAWNTVSGIPTVDYKAKWEMLKTIPIDISNPLTNRNPNANFEVGIDDLSLGESGSITLGQEFQGSFSNIVREQARQYLNSFPGNDALGCNSHHAAFQRLVREESFDKEHFDKEHLEDLSNILCYRMSTIKLATDFKDYLDLQIADAHLFDTWAWEVKTLEACDINEPDITKAKEPWTRYENIQSLIDDAGIFTPATRSQGFSYSKPSEYLAIAFYESGRLRAQILKDIEKLTHRKCPNLILYQKLQ
jgi:hypothetical protein